MSLLRALQAGVAVADTVTKSLQAKVVYRLLLDAGSGKAERVYADPVELPAIVDRKQQSVRTASGEMSVSRSSVLFLDIEALVRATGGSGVGMFDTITLPDGTTGPILDIKGFVDRSTGHPISTEVFLG